MRRKNLSQQANELFDNFQQLTPSEFFRKNKQMLGFTGKIRSLTIVFHELITNSFDAAEEAGILPEINIELKRIDKEHYILRHSDNGPGIPEDFVMQVYCSMFAGSKFRNIQSRGQQGLGCSGCVLLSQMTTGEPARVISCYQEGDDLKGVKMKFKMDVKKNKGMLMEREDFPAEHTGVCIELQFKDVSYSMAEQGAFEYIRRTMIGNPHAKITFRDPTGHKYIFKRAANIVPILPKEVLPHPKGVSADDILFMAKHTDKRRYKSMLTSSLSRMSNKRVNEIEELTGIDMNKRPKDMTWAEAEAIVNCFKKMKFMAPPSNGLIPIGSEQIEKGMKQILKPEFIATLTRKPVTYGGGVSFIIEAGIAYGGDSGRVVNEQRKSEIMRFANRVPLTFDQGSCAITEALKSIDWKRYGIKDFDNSPVTLFVNIISTQVPYLSTGKQSVSPEPEIVHEIRQATMTLARKLQKHLRAKKAAKEKAMRSKVFEDYLPVIIEEAAKLGETAVPEYNQVLAKVTKRALAELLGEKFGDAVGAEVKIMIDTAYVKAQKLIRENMDKLDRVAQALIEKEVIHQNGNFLELDVRFLDFFETLLEANEEIDTATIDENIEYLHELMDYYLKEKIQSRKESYVRNIKLTFQKIARVTIRNIMNLQNSIDNTFKHEPTYQIKIAKLKNLDKKRINIQNLIDSTEHLILHEERLFFQQATDEELGRILLELRQELQLSAHSLIRAQQDIINYLNQIKNQVILVEKIRKVKYLQDQFELRARSNLAEVMENEHSVLLEGCTQTSFKLSPEYLASDEARPIILRILSNRKTREHIRKNEAGAFSEEDMKAQAMYEEVVNLEEVVKSFLQSGAEAQWKNEQPKDLFTFLLHYSFQREVNEEECTTLFCQIVSLYEDKLEISDDFGRYKQYEYAKIYPL